MNRCERGAENIPDGYYYDCVNDIFIPIPPELDNTWLIVICIISLILLFFYRN
jgi:hypothetical protein